ncbi:hypothetical protein [Sphingomonas sp.]|jgi:hypothetical protein|uniref:hypothetical protein n=1 Tax=Sphingomonas sp. TaxID=28214 RepID=UPI000DBBBB1F|nr:hypothetical protein [Sphingomonas sp.]PZT94147.1 MAG: hypothetical protein DI625_08405 [Sphingomonas sp.]
MIERLSPTSFRLSGLAKGLDPNLDDEAFYGGDEQIASSEKAKDMFTAWAREKGHEEAGKRMTPEQEDALEQAFWEYRIATLAAERPEGAWLREQGLWQDCWADAYKQNGTLEFSLPDVETADRVAAQFSV